MTRRGSATISSGRRGSAWVLEVVRGSRWGQPNAPRQFANLLYIVDLAVATAVSPRPQAHCSTAGPLVVSEPSRVEAPLRPFTPARPTAQR